MIFVSGFTNQLFRHMPCVRPRIKDVLIETRVHCRQHETAPDRFGADLASKQCLSSQGRHGAVRAPRFELNTVSSTLLLSGTTVLISPFFAIPRTREVILFDVGRDNRLPVVVEWRVLVLVISWSSESSSSVPSTETVPQSCAHLARWLRDRALR